LTELGSGSITLRTRDREVIDNCEGEIYCSKDNLGSEGKLYTPYPTF
jgi:hypothetical protein